MQVQDVEGLGEMAAECRENDPFLVSVVKKCTLCHNNDHVKTTCL